MDLDFLGAERRAGSGFENKQIDAAFPDEIAQEE
jgi:hypothetical protein